MADLGKDDFEIVKIVQKPIQNVFKKIMVYKNSY